MTLHDWIDHQITTGKARNRGDAIELLRASLPMPISAATLAAVDRGAKIRSYERAKSILEATDGMVTIPELCE